MKKGRGRRRPGRRRPAANQANLCLSVQQRGGSDPELGPYDRLHWTRHYLVRSSSLARIASAALTSRFSFSASQRRRYHERGGYRDLSRFYCFVFVCWWIFFVGCGRSRNFERLVQVELESVVLIGRVQLFRHHQELYVLVLIEGND
jgi:hypothetical protein